MQFKDANLNLAKYLEKHPKEASKFTQADIDRLNAGITPKGFTWHHMPEPTGGLQLIPEEIHKVKHFGGRGLWGGGSKKR